MIRKQSSLKETKKHKNAHGENEERICLKKIKEARNCYLKTIREVSELTEETAKNMVLLKDHIENRISMAKKSVYLFIENYFDELQEELLAKFNFEKQKESIREILGSLEKIKKNEKNLGKLEELLTFGETTSQTPALQYIFETDFIKIYMKNFKEISEKVQEANLSFYDLGTCCQVTCREDKVEKLKETLNEVIQVKVANEEGEISFASEYSESQKARFGDLVLTPHNSIEDKNEKDSSEKEISINFQNKNNHAQN